MSVDRPHYTEPEEMFIRVSMKFPASVTVQAALVAIESREKNINPGEFCNFLETNLDAASRLYDVGSKFHKIDIFKMKAIFNHVFSFAEEMLALNNETLENIVNEMHKRYFFKDINVYREDEFQRDVREKIEAVKALNSKT